MAPQTVGNKIILLLSSLPPHKLWEPQAKPPWGHLPTAPTSAMTSQAREVVEERA